MTIEVVDNLEDDGFEEATTALDLFIFGDICNNWVRGPLGQDYDVTFVGDDYLVRHIPTGKCYPFKVKIERGSETDDWSQAISEQEWDQEDEW